MCAGGCCRGKALRNGKTLRRSEFLRYLLVLRVSQGSHHRLHESLVCELQASSGKGDAVSKRAALPDFGTRSWLPKP